jgi:hypothetical protein
MELLCNIGIDLAKGDAHLNPISDDHHRVSFTQCYCVKLQDGVFSAVTGVNYFFPLEF